MHPAQHQLLLYWRRRRRRWRRRWWWRWGYVGRRRRRQHVSDQAADQSAHHYSGGASDLISLSGTIYRGESAAEPSASECATSRAVLGVLPLLRRPRRARRDRQKCDGRERANPIFPLVHRYPP